jgi:RluA family pseudouridine synthase
LKQKRHFSILHEDDCIVAVNKTSGISVCADRWNYSKRRLDALLEEFLGKQLWKVHRIDSGTSGIVVFAKNARTHRLLSIAFETRQVHKVYLAAVHGFVRWAETDCDAPLVVNGNKRRQTIIDRYQGKKSLTHFKRLSCAGALSLVEAVPESGRTHQIRVHLASLGHPIVCDPLYGSEKPVYLSSFKKGWRGDPFEERPLIERLALHAFQITLPDYGKGPVRIEAPPPRDMAALIKQIEKNEKQTAPL